MDAEMLAIYNELNDLAEELNLNRLSEFESYCSSKECDDINFNVIGSDLFQDCDFHIDEEKELVF